MIHTPCAFPYFIYIIVTTTTAPCWCLSEVNRCPIFTPWLKESGSVTSAEFCGGLAPCTVCSGCKTLCTELSFLKHTLNIQGEMRRPDHPPELVKQILIPQQYSLPGFAIYWICLTTRGERILQLHCLNCRI